jgi:hypothetical protein
VVAVSLKNSVKSGDDTYYLFPSKKFSFKADPKKVIEYGCVYPGFYKETEEGTEIYFDTVLNIDLNREYLLKNEMMILDLLNTNDWERPIYITSLGSRHTLNLDNYFHNEGFAYRLTPMNKKAKAPEGVASSDINTDVMYNNLMNVYTWGNINDPNVYIDQTILRTTKIVKIRSNFGELAKALVKEGKTDKAKEVMARCDSVMPPAMYPVSYFDCDYTEGYYQAGEAETADSILVAGIESVLTELNYYKSLDKQTRNTNAQEIQLNIATLGRIVSIFQKNERTELFNTYYSLYAENAEWYENL